MAPRLLLDRSAPPREQEPALDEEQRRVVAHRGGPLLVLAGPGTGKTTTLVEAMVARLSGPDALPPEQVLGLTFGRQAAGEWRDRVLARLGGGVPPTVATFHAFAWSIVRAHFTDLALDRSPRLLSGAEDDSRVREVLAGAIEDGTLPWPQDLQAALSCPTGLADEVRAVIARARLLGMGPEDLARAASAAGDAGWNAAASFMRQYEDVLSHAAETDYASLVSDAIAVLRTPHVERQWRGRYRLILVDEFQDTDPAQAELLRCLMTADTTLVCVGDPDQSIYAFRGAHLANIERFADDFGATQPPVVLSRGHRFGPVIRTAVTGIVQDMGYAGLTDHLARHRALDCTHAETPGRVEVLHLPSATTQAATIADLVRRACAHDGLGWDDVAVIVRSRLAIPALERALLMADIPVSVAAEDDPLVLDPAVVPLLTALRVVARPDSLTPDVAAALLQSPLAMGDATELRRLARALRAAERAVDPLAARTPSAEVLRDAIREPALLSGIPEGPARPGADAVRRLARLLTHARSVLDAGAGVPEVLWALWQGPDVAPSPWPERLRTAALNGGSAGRRADRDLDALCLLFEVAGDTSRRRPRQGIIPFLTDLHEQQVAATTREARRGDAPAVRLMTAHRAKGLQWPLVVVAGVQEGTWPDLRRRGSLLQPDRLGPDGRILDPVPASALLREERRLFYVACTRARRRLVVTAVEADSDGEQPSRLLGMLGVEPTTITSRPPRPLAVAPLVASLRTALEAPESSPALRRAAAQRLARLSARVPAARPSSWWGTTEVTTAAPPVRAQDEPIRLSGSALATLDSCPRKWFLEREARADEASSVAQSFGNVVHAVAEHVTLGTLPDDMTAIDASLDAIWPRLGYDAEWYSRLQRREAGAAIARFLSWHRGQLARGHEVIGIESPFTATLELPAADGSPQAVLLQGFIDRIELVPGGPAGGPRHVRVFDLKTEARPPQPREVARHPQLAFYQLAVREDAVEGLTDAESVGAALVQLRAGTGDGPTVQEQPALQLDEQPTVGAGSAADDVADGTAGETGDSQTEPLDPRLGTHTWIERMLADAALTVRSERFDAVPSHRTCRVCSFASSCPARPEGREVLP